MTRTAAAVIVLLTLSVSGCATGGGAAPSVSIMTFNAQNLFDTTHDPGKDDHTYLPFASKDNDEHRARCAVIEVARWRDECLHWDWSEDVLEVKLERLAAAILANAAGGPDIVVFQEVENVAVLERLRRDHLAGVGYLPAILVEGRDARGIDVAFLSKLPQVGEARLHPARFERIDPKREKDTRGVLEASFRLPDGQVLTGFAVHFPAPFHPADLRVQAYAHLDRLVAALPAGRSYFAAGDFNTISRESAIIDEHVEPRWVVAHRVACAACPGTYYYAPDDNWSFLDMILLSQNLAPGSGGWAMDSARTRVATAYPAQVREPGVPAAFTLPARSGVSDHWPLVVELVLTGGGGR